MTDTEWTKYAFALPGDGEPYAVDSVRPVPCEVTIAKDGYTIIALDTDPMRRSHGMVVVSLDQLTHLTVKVQNLRFGHQGNIK